MVVFGSCATTLRLPDDASPGGEFAALDGGGYLYFTADVQRFRPILEKTRMGGLSAEQAGAILDRTDQAVGALYSPAKKGAPSGSRSWLIAAKGQYPSTLASMYFGASSGWKKAASAGGGKYWRSGDQRLSVYIDPRYALVSSGDPLYRREALTVPEHFASYRADSLFALWLDDAGTFTGRFLAGLPIAVQAPVDRIIFAVYPEDHLVLEEKNSAGDNQRYYGLCRLETPSANHAKALASIIRLLSSAATGSLDEAVTALLLGNPATVDGSAVVLKTSPLDAGAFALLFAAFPLSSK
jgi:hypothetical protein